MRPTSGLFLLPLVLGCPSKKDSIIIGDIETGLVQDDTGLGPDRDGDGFPASEDCDDADASIHPDADELCDGIDNNCDGQVDTPDSVDAGTWYTDGDGDGFGAPDGEVRGCEQPSGTAELNTDCNDEDPGYYYGESVDKIGENQSHIKIK